MADTVNLNFEFINSKFEALINKTSVLEDCQKIFICT